MADQAIQVSTTALADTKSAQAVRRRQWSEAFKRQVAAETLEAGSSVSIVAGRHDMNANQLFKWRREMLPKQRWRRSKAARCYRLRSCRSGAGIGAGRIELGLSRSSLAAVRGCGFAARWRRQRFGR